MSYDAELKDWDTVQPIGSIALALCTCKTTLGIATTGWPMTVRLALLQWIKDETQARGVGARELLDHVRHEVRKEVLAEPDRD